jgi:hypothetical protein
MFTAVTDPPLTTDVAVAVRRRVAPIATDGTVV